MRDLRQARIQGLVEAGLYLVTDDRLPPAELEARLWLALEAGARVVQFRHKADLTPDVIQLAWRLRDITRQWRAQLLVNDYPQLASQLEADGVHVGQEDCSPTAARRIIGPDRLVGLSVSSVSEAMRAAELEIDYLGVGAMYSTETKPDAEYGGLELLRQVRSAVDLPLVAIGGITLERVPEVMQAGADCIAVVSAVFSAGDPGSATRELLAAIGSHPPRRDC